MTLGRESWLLVIAPTAIFVGAIWYLFTGGDADRGPRPIHFAMPGEPRAAGEAAGDSPATGQAERTITPAPPRSAGPSAASGETAAPGLGEAEGDADREPDAPITLDPWVGTVVDRAGAPIRGATVRVRARRNLMLADATIDAEGETLVITTGEDGSVVVPREPGFLYELEVRAPGYGAELYPLSGDTRSLLQLDRAGTLTGRVLRRESGTPVPGATVTFQNGVDTISLTTDAEGRYRIDGVSARTARIEASSSSFVAASRQIDSIRPGLVVGFDLVVDRGAILDGEIIDGGTGAPLEGTTVFLVDRWTRQSVSFAATDAAGRFQFNSLNPVREYTVMAYGGGFFAESLARVLSGTNRASVRMALAPSWTLAIQVTDAGGTPLPGARVVVRRSDGAPLAGTEMSRSAFANEAGVARVGGLSRMASYRVVVMHHGHAASELPMVTSAIGDDVTFPIVLGPPVTLTGSVIDSAGNPVPFVTVRVTRLDGVAAPALFAVADAGGTFSVAEIAAGKVSVVAFKAGFDSTRLTADLTPAEDSMPLVLTLTPLN